MKIKKPGKKTAVRSGFNRPLAELLFLCYNSPTYSFFVSYISIILHFQYLPFRLFFAFWNTERREDNAETVESRDTVFAV
jgi:hypothetical protein